MERWTSVVGDSVSGHVTGQVCVERRLNVPSRGELFKRTPEGGALSPSLGGASGRRRLGTEVSLSLPLSLGTCRSGAVTVPPLTLSLSRAIYPSPFYSHAGFDHLPDSLYLERVSRGHCEGCECSTKVSQRKYEEGDYAFEVSCPRD